MPSILTSKPEISDVVLYEQFKEYGHCRVNDTVTVTAGMEIGTVVEWDTTKYVAVLNGGVALLDTNVAVIIDDAVYDGVTGDRTLTLLQMPAGGVAGVKIGGLQYQDAVSAANKLIVQAALAVKGMKSFVTV